MRISDRLLAAYRSIRTKTFYGYQHMRLSGRGLNWDSTKYLKAYETSLYVYACVKKRAEKVGQIDFRLRNSSTKKEIEDHEVLNLLYKPNPFQTKNEFFELYQTYKDLVGSTYIYLLRVGTTKRVAEMYLLRPDWITAVMNKATGLIEGYKYRAGGEEQFFPAEDVIASHYPSPTRALAGQSPLQAGATSVDTEQQLATYQNEVLRNGGKVEGIFSFNVEGLTKEQIEKLKQQYADQQAGADKAGLPLFMAGGAKYENLGLTPTELSYVESRKTTRADILLLYGIPRQILSQDEGGGLAGDGYDQANRVFLSETIKPLLDNLVTKLDEDQSLVPSPLELWYVDPTPENVDVKIKKVESGLKTGYLTINEARAEVGREPVDGGDVILISFGLVPLTDVAFSDDEEPAPAVDPEAKAKFAAGAHPLRNKAIREAYGKQVVDKLRRREQEAMRALRTYFRQQLERVKKKLDTGQPKALADEVFDLTAEAEFAKKAFMPLFLKWAKAAGVDAVLFSGSDRPFNLSQRLRTTLEKRVTLFAEEINKTTQKKLTAEFAASAAAGESRPDLIKRVTATFGEISKGRARTISRTEVGVASQEGTFEGYKQAGVGIKIWVSTQDEVTRESHSLIDGEERPIDMPFSNGLMFPLDPGGDPEETVNCRCSI